jgi:nucleoside-diphosphate-sugar epimerase
VLRGTAHSIRVGPLVTSRDFIDVRDVATAACHAFRKWNS